MTPPQAPNGMDLAVWLRLRAERRGQAGVVAGYVHELSDRHGSNERPRESDRNGDDASGDRA